MSHRRERRHRPDNVTHDDPVKWQFSADGPDRVWITDITQHHASGGWVYRCAVIDSRGSRVGGSAVFDHVRSKVVGDALEMARWHRSPAAHGRPAGIHGTR